MQRADAGVETTCSARVPIRPARAAVVTFALACVLVAAEGRAVPLRWPVESVRTVTAYFDEGGGRDWRCGDNTYPDHRGTDVGALRGTPVLSAATGVVDHRADGFGDGCIGCTAGNGFGNHVELWHPDGTATLYAHLRADSGLPSLGVSLPCGAILGVSGASGNVTGPHMHFELRYGGAFGQFYSGQARDPFAGPCSTNPRSDWLDQAGADPVARCANTVPDGGFVRSSGDDAGCGCRVRPTNAHPAWWLLSVSLALWCARRRDRRGFAVIAVLWLQPQAVSGVDARRVWFTQDGVLYALPAVVGARDPVSIPLPGTVARVLPVDDGRAAVVMVCPREATEPAGDVLPSGCAVYRTDGAHASRWSEANVTSFDVSPTGALAYTLRDGSLRIDAGEGAGPTFHGRDALWVRWSADEQRVVFLTGAMDPARPATVVVREVATGAERTIAEGDVSAPLWGDGATVLWLTTNDGVAEARAMRIDDPHAAWVKLSLGGARRAWRQDALRATDGAVWVESRYDDAPALHRVDPSGRRPAVVRERSVAPQRVGEARLCVSIEPTRPVVRTLE